MGDLEGSTATNIISMVGSMEISSVVTRMQVNSEEISLVTVDLVATNLVWAVINLDLEMNGINPQVIIRTVEVGTTKEDLGKVAGDRFSKDNPPTININITILLYLMLLLVHQTLPATPSIYSRRVCVRL